MTGRDEVRRGEIVVEGLTRPILEAGTTDDEEAVVCLHGNRGSREQLHTVSDLLADLRVSDNWAVIGCGCSHHPVRLRDTTSETQ